MTVEDILSSAGLIEYTDYCSVKLPGLLFSQIGEQDIMAFRVKKLVDFCNSAFRVSIAVFLCVVIRWPA